MIPRSDQHVNFPHNFNEMSVRQILRMTNRCGLDKTPNSHEYPAKKSMVLVRRMYVSILGMKGLKSAAPNMNANKVFASDTIYHCTLHYNSVHLPSSAKAVQVHQTVLRLSRLKRKVAPFRKKRRGVSFMWLV